MTVLWDCRTATPRLCAPTEAISVARPPPAGALQGQCAGILALLESLNPSREWLAAAGYRVEHLAGADLGGGWAAVPVLGADAQGRPAAVRMALAAPVDERTLDDLATALRATVQARADLALERGAADYAWPEAADWANLEADARAYLASRESQTPVIGRSLRADVGSDAPDALLAGAQRVVARADAFRALRGAIVQRRRALHEAVDTALAAADRPALLTLDVLSGWPA